MADTQNLEDVVVEGNEEEGDFGAPPVPAGELSQQTRDGIIEYLTEELGKVLYNSERTELMEKIKKWTRQREAIPAQSRKNTPWEGASNVVPPLAMMNTNGAYSIIKRALGAKKPFVTVSPYGDQKTRAGSVEHLLSLVMEGRQYMNIRQRNTDIAYMLASIGTQFVKIPWRRDEWNYKYKDPQTGEIKTNVRVLHDSPVLETIPVEDFFTRVTWPDLQRAPWYAERIWLMEHELLQRKNSGRFEYVDNVLERGTGEVSETRLEQLRNAGVEPLDPSDAGAYDIFECALYWDIDDDGIAEDLKIWFDLPSGNILRWELNPMGRRDVFRLPFIERPGQLYAMGIGWIVETLQDEAEALHNMRVDGTKLQAFQMYVTRTGSNLGPNEDFFPLKNIQVDNPKEDFIPVKFPDISAGTYQAELLTKQYADRATGVSDALLGFHQQGDNSRKTASGTMFLANQSSALMDSIMEGIEGVFGEIAEVVVLHLLYHPERTREIATPLEEETKQEIEAFLRTDPNQLMNTLQFSIQSTEQDKTMEARKQQLMTLTQLYTMYGQQVFQMLPMIYSQQQNVPGPIKQVAAKFFEGATNLMDKVFHLMDQPDTEDYLPYIKDIEMMNENIAAMKDQKIASVKQQMQGGGEENAQQQQSGETGGPVGPEAGGA